MASWMSTMMPFYEDCMKHKPSLNSRVQWMLNKLEDKLIPKKYASRFFSLLCKCPKNMSHRIEDPWENVLSRHLILSVRFIDNYVSHNTDNAQAAILKEMMIYLRRQHVIPSVENLPRLDSAQCPEEIADSSALRMLYILQKVIEGNFTMLDPPRVAGVEEQRRREEMTMTFDLEDFNHEYLGNLIGGQGANILKFMREHKCFVKFDKVQDGEDFKVQATIKKRSANQESLARIKPELIDFSKECQKMEKAYEEIKRQKLIERKENFTELLKKTEGMGPNADWNTILLKIGDDDLYEDIKTYVEFAVQKQWFQEIRENWSQIIRSDEEDTEVKCVVGNEASYNQQSSSVDQPLSVEETTSRITATIQSTLQASAVAPSSLSTANNSEINQSAAGSLAIRQENTDIGQSTSGTSQMATCDIGTSRMAKPNTLCLVHDRRWVATFQYFLSQCYSRIQLPRKYGFPFCVNVCTCEQSVPDPKMYFPLDGDMQHAFNQVKMSLKCWPEEQRTIIQPLLHQLEKYDKADTWFSLMKFVYYFEALIQNKYDKLEPDAKLPGTQTQSSTIAASAAQSSVLPRPEIGSSLGGANLGSASSLHVSSLATVPKVLNTRNGSGASTVAPQSPGAADGTAPVRRTLKLKKLNVEDWVDDCFFHGKKKKFLFQCIVNYLHHHTRLHTKLNIPFSLAVCCCNETIELEQFFSSEQDCKENCMFMKEKLELWRGDSKTSIKPCLTLLDAYLTNKSITGGFIKFVYCFKKAYTGDLVEFHEIRDQLKRQR